ncbi:hypothetical protein JKF63_00884 [Porcisia hertigi]|uniref:Cilia- and flagella-associated protein 206 n=1 Tax=Porcisia hertigi TaxID=2761500 RepID=A0A836KYR2_9TRYP|nr:hypothetical protein JKF63_00884 [Porcisia hertigi]
MKKILHAAAAVEAAPPISIEDIRERLWRALPSVQQHQQRIESEAPDEDAGAVQPHETGDSLHTDVDKNTASSSLFSVVLPRSEMAHLVSCIYLALHGNALDSDTRTAVEVVLRAGALGITNSDGVDAAAAVAEPRETYTHEDFVAFLESVPTRWMPGMISAQRNEEEREKWVDFNAELVDCVVNDEEPYNLLQPTEVLTIQRTAAPVYLEAPVAEYIEVLPPRLYPAIYDTLSEKLHLHGDASNSIITLPQFRLFFEWFHGLHFRNTNALRSSEAAEYLYKRYRDPHGQLTVLQFQLACEEICAVYAQRSDAAAYLQELVHRTEEAKAYSNQGDAATAAQQDARTNADFFLHPEEVTLSSWRRDLLSPVTLYMPDELRAVQQEAERYHRHRCPRILLLGPVGIGKSDVGRQLAEELHCVHLDVLELAMTALRNPGKAPVAEMLAACLAEGTPIPMTVQVQLVQEALSSARVEYRGYVLSDTLFSTAGTTDAFNEHFVNSLQLAEVSMPDHVVELCTAVSDVYLEHARDRISAAAAASRRAVDAFVKEQAKKAQALEKAQMRADCEKILAHLLELESATGKAAPPASDLELARQQAAEAQDILDALEEEEEEQKADAERNQEDTADEPENANASPFSALSEKQATEMRLRLSALIYEGRLSAGVQPPFTVADDVESAVTLPSLEEQDWTSSWREHVDSAKSIDRHVLVDPIASASTKEVTAYIAKVFRLYPCDEPTFLGLPRTGEREDGQHEEGDYDQFYSVAMDEDTCRLVEEAAQHAQLSLSPVWKRYCPVTAFEDHVLVEGAACYACAYRGCYYLFASSSKRAAFMDFPVKYLRQRSSAYRKPLLVVADDTLVHSTSAVVEAMQHLVGEIAAQFDLRPYTVSEFVKHLEPRQTLLQKRHETCVERQQAEDKARKARAERKELAAKALAKKNKGKGRGKAVPTKPKLKKPTGEASAVSSKNQASQQQQQQSGTSATDSSQRRGLQSSILEGPQSMADKKMMIIRAETEKAARAPPVLLSAVTPTDLQGSYLQRLWENGLMPESVLVLRPAAATASMGAEEEDEAKTGDVEGSGASVLSQILELLESGPMVQWRSVTAEAGHASQQEPQPFNVLYFTLPEVPVVHEIVAEVMQQLDPLAIQAREAFVDEALGEEDENADDEEAEELAEEAALLNPDEEAVPQVPRPPRHPLTRPMCRFLHQFGSRLDYCPVTLHDRGILVRGRQEFCLRHLDGLYIFATQEACDAFTRCPQRYIGELPPEKLPPRLWLVGSVHSGKKTLAGRLQEDYRVPFFKYDRQFFEECIEAAITPGGGMVSGVFIPQDVGGANPFVSRARMLLEEVRNTAEKEKAKLKDKAEAERLLREREQREEELAARSGSGLDEEDEEEEDNWDEAKEAELQEKLEFEPEDPEDKQMRLNEAYLRIASCVTRFHPFETLGYVMICPPFSDSDLEILFEEGCVPEVVLRLNIEGETFAQRNALRHAQRQEELHRVQVQDTAARKAEAERKTTQAARDAARLQRRREKALRKWRRRHIGVNDIDSPSDADDEAVVQQTEEAPDVLGGGTGQDSEVADADVPGEGDAPLPTEDTFVGQEEALDEFVDCVEERLVEIVRIDGRAAKETVYRAAVDALGRHMRYRASLFYVPEVISFEDAQARLVAGSCDLSSFGYEDPVRVYRHRQGGPQIQCAWKPAGVRVSAERPQRTKEEYYGVGGHVDAEKGNPNELEEPEELSEVFSDDLQELRDVVERRKKRRQREAALRVARVHHRLYFFEDDDSLLCFVRDPWPFIRQAPPNPMLLQQPVVSVYDLDDRYAAEKSGEKERVLADSIAFNLRVKCVSIPSLLTWGAVHPHWQMLKLDCMLAAERGFVEADLVHKLLTLYLSTAEVKRTGAVLLNLPNTGFSAESISQIACAAPIVKVMATSFAFVNSGAPSEPPEASVHAKAEGCAAAFSTLGRHAAVHFSLPRPSVSLDASNLVAAVHGVEEHVLQAEEAMLQRYRAFPTRLSKSYQVYRHLHHHLSPYGAFCPYEWLEHDDLVRSVRVPTTTAEEAIAAAAISPPATNEVDLRWGAIYLNQYYFFSSAEYLERFLSDPTTVTDPSKVKPMPKQLPSVVASPVEEADLALEGCCPVLLYDTREHRGMRGVIQPVAKKGSLNSVVEYDGQLYALRNMEHMARFLRRPWQYVEGAHLPQVLRRPLPSGTRPSDIVDHEEYIQRQMYDPVALALLAVAQTRPIYPGLSVEESALKYIALYLKAHRDPDYLTSFEETTYREYFEMYQRRATLYKHVPLRPEARKTQKAQGDAASAMAASATISGREYCVSVGESMSDANDMSFFNRLPCPR